MQNQPNPNQISARELYNGCTSKNQTIREQSYELLWRYVYSSVRYLVDNSEDAEDLTQSTLIKIYGKIENVNTSDAFKGWVQQTLRNEFIDWLRKNRKHKYQPLPPNLFHEPIFPSEEFSDEPAERLFNISQGKKTKWAWIGRYHYGLRDKDLACVENLLCEKSVQESTFFIARAKTKSHWIKAKFVDLFPEAKFQPIDPTDSDPIFQELFQQLLIAKSWHLLYDAPLDKGARWAWIGRHIYEMSDKDLASVENLLCNSTIHENIMPIRRTKSRKNLKKYSAGLQVSTKS